MARQASADLDIDTKRSYMIGDKREDVLFGKNIGASTVLVLTGYGRKSLLKLEETGIMPTFVARDLLEAVNWILEKEKI